MNKDKNEVICIGEPIAPHEIGFNPITLQLFKNEESEWVCPTFVHIVKDAKEFVNSPITSVKKVTDLSNIKKIKSTTLTYLTFTPELILNLYKISDSDTLIKFIDDSIAENKPIDTINRVLNLWIKNEIDILKENHQILIPIYTKISKKYFNNTHISKTKINKWFKKVQVTDFIFDLLEHLVK